MKRLIVAVTVAVLSIGSLYPVTHSKKTFLMPRAVGNDKAMELSAWHHHLFGDHDTHETIRSHFSVTGFYKRLVNDERLGAYFGVGNGRNSFRVGSDSNRDIDGRFLIHTDGGRGGAFLGRLISSLLSVLFASATASLNGTDDMIRMATRNRAIQLLQSPLQDILQNQGSMLDSDLAQSAFFKAIKIIEDVQGKFDQGVQITTEKATDVTAYAGLPAMGNLSSKSVRTDIAIRMFQRFLQNPNENPMTATLFPARGSSVGSNVSFKVDHEAFGFNLSYVQELSAPIKNLFFKANLPIVHVRNDVRMVETNTTSVTIGGKDFSLADFFAGRVQVTSDDDPDNQQDPLTHAKISGRRSASGPADLTLELGYRHYHEHDGYALISAHLLIPTGTKVRGEYLFEPVYGNGHHLGFGFGIDAGTLLWQGDAGSISLNFAAQYRYLFEGTESRTVGLKNMSGFAGKKFTHYYLGGINGQEDAPLFPLANVLTTALRVQPGSQLQGVINASFENSRFILDAGYNLYWKDKESLWVKGWDDNKYRIAGDNFTTEIESLEKDSDLQRVGLTLPVIPEDDINQLNNERQALGQQPVPVKQSVPDLMPAPLFNGSASELITRDNLDTDAAKTPGQMTHKFHASLAYKTMMSDRYPTTLSLGASYELPHTNAALEQYTLWGKIGISF